MRYRAAFLSLVVGCGGGTPLDGKEWKPTLDYDDASFGAAVDREERLVTMGMRERHTFRLDPDTTLWDDLGVSAENHWGDLRSDGDGTIYSEYVAPFGEVPRRRLYRLDDRTWTRIAGFDLEITTVLARDGTWWGVELVPAPTSTKLYKLVGGAFELQATIPDRWLTIRSSVRGELYATDENGMGLWKVSPAGGLEAVLACGTVIDPACGPSYGMRVDAGGNVTFYGGNPAIGHTLYRIAAGSGKAEVQAAFPDIPVDAPHVFGFEYDGEGNAYLVYGDNVSSAADLFFLEAGASEWQKVIRWPLLSGTVYLPYVGREGTVYAANTGGPHMILK